MTATNIREENERLQKELEILRAKLNDEQELSSATPFDTPQDALKWLSAVILYVFKKSNRQDSLKRLRAISAAVDVWCKTFRLSADTAELLAIKERLEALELSLKDGPRGVVSG